MRRRRILPILLLSVVVARAEPPALRYADGRLTASVEQVPLDEVLDAIARETGARVTGDIAEPRDVTAHFDDLPMDRALDRLLGSQSFTLRYAADGRLVAIELRGMPMAPATKSTERAALPNLQWYRVELPPSLAKVQRRTHAPLNAIIRWAGKDQSPKVRAEAMRLMVTTIEGDAKLRAALVDMSDEELIALLRDRAGQGTTELVGGMMGAARSIELRVKAGRMYQSLRAPAVASGPG